MHSFKCFQVFKPLKLSGVIRYGKPKTSVTTANIALVKQNVVEQDVESRLFVKILASCTGISEGSVQKM